MRFVVYLYIIEIVDFKSSIIHQIILAILEKGFLIKYKYYFVSAELLYYFLTV